VISTKKKGKIINTDNLKKTFLNELENNGLIDHEISQIHGKQYIYYPLVEPFDNKINNNDNNKSSSFSSNLSQFDQISQYSSKIYGKIITNLTENQLFYEIEGVFPHRIDMTKFTTDTKEELESYFDNHIEDLKILDANNNNSRITIRQFIQDYISENSQSRFDEKRSSDLPPFDKTSQSSSNLGKFDERDEKSSLEISCHYCNYKGKSESEVLNHSVISHPGKPARPDPDLAELINNKDKQQEEL
jgi:hypothetical protein